MWTTLDLVFFSLMSVAHTLLVVAVVALGAGATEAFTTLAIAIVAVSLISIVVAICAFVTDRRD